MPGETDRQTAAPQEQEPQALDSRLKALADPVRRSILRTLRREGLYCTVDGVRVWGICVRDLAVELELPQSTVSRHLGILRAAGLVAHSQKNTWHYYRCEDEAVEQVVSWLRALCGADGGADSPHP